MRKEPFKFVYAWIYRPSRCDWVRTYVTREEALMQKILLLEMQQPGLVPPPGHTKSNEGV